MDTLTTFSGQFDLVRWPRQKNDPLRAWDAADEYLLNYLAQLPAFQSGSLSRVLIVNDSHGALACALHELDPVSWSDSYVAHESARKNLELNQITSALQCVASTDELVGQFDLVLVRIPKTTALLDEQMIKLRAHLHKQSVVVAAGMIKHMQKSAFSSFEKYIGPVSTSLAQKKARLIFSAVDESLTQATSPYPTFYKEQDLKLVNHANVFSREQLDLGSRFFLSQYTHLPVAETVVDLACGNGILGIRYKQLHQNARLDFVDESYMAVASSRENYENAFPESQSDARFLIANGLQQHADESIDLVLCNPPFHQQHAVGDRIALDMFQDSKRCLKQGGELWVVANRHLSHLEVVKRLFGNCRVVASNKKFTVMRVVKR